MKRLIILLKKPMPLKDNKLPLVSVIALCYNQEKYLIETLNSIINQSYQNIELIITDDYSTDDSIKEIQQWINQNNVKCTFKKNKKNIGICKSLNNAIKLVKGEYLNLIACDDILLPNKIKNQVEQFNQSDAKSAVVYSDTYIIRNQKSSLKFLENILKITSPPSGNVYNKLLQRNFIPACTALIKRTSLNKIGQYDEKLSFEDYDMWLRISKKYNFIFSDDIQTYYRLHENNISKNINWSYDHYWIYRKHQDNIHGFKRFHETFLEIYAENDFKSPELIDYRKNYASTFIKCLLYLKIPFQTYSKYKFFFSLFGKRSIE